MNLRVLSQRDILTYERVMIIIHCLPSSTQSKNQNRKYKLKINAIHSMERSVEIEMGLIIF